MPFQKFIILISLLAVGGCAVKGGAIPEPSASAKASPAEQGVNVASIADAIPEVEPLSESGNAPYSVFGKDYLPLGPSTPYAAEGLASWYGSSFHGRRTASGEAFNMYAMSAAHRTLPLPSYLRVTNIENERSVVVRLNDRGPFVEPQQRIVELSYAAATKLGIVETGTAHVRIEALDPAQINADEQQATQESAPAPPPMPAQVAPVDQANVSYLQLGAFSDKREAEQFLKRSSDEGISGYIEQAGGLFIVKAGPYVDADQALRHKLDIDQMLDIEARVVFE